MVNRAFGKPSAKVYPLTAPVVPAPKVLRAQSPTRRASDRNVVPMSNPQAMSLDKSGMSKAEMRADYERSNKMDITKLKHRRKADEANREAEARETARILAGSPTKRNQKIEYNPKTDFTNDKPKPKRL